jgi:hypothetical protein
MSTESAVVKAICAISFSLASNGFLDKGNVTMAVITGIASAVSAILFVREVYK